MVKDGKKVWLRHFCILHRETYVLILEASTLQETIAQSMKSFFGGKISTCECIAKRFSDASGCCRIIVGADWTFRGRFRLHSSLPYQITENISQPFSCIPLHAKSILHALLQFDFQRKYIVYSGLPNKNGKIWLPTIFKHCVWKELFVSHSKVWLCETKCGQNTRVSPLLVQRRKVGKCFR